MLHSDADYGRGAGETGVEGIFLVIEYLADWELFTDLFLSSVYPLKSFSL